jgi:hypothetical protein
MNISQVNGRQEYGTIDSIANFTPPFTLTAVVEGIVSNGHTFGLAITTQNASSGVQVYGNLNPTNCSNLGDCGDPNVCGNTSNPDVIPPNQCYYGLDVKVGQGGTWTKTARLDMTPSVNVTYTLQISVDASGNVQYSASQGGQVLGVGNAKVGTGPFYVIMYQSEGSPVEPAKPNQALWMSISLTPNTTTITYSVSSTPGPTSPGITTTTLIIIVVVAAFLLIIVLLLYLRRRGFTVIVQDSQTRAPLFKATVSANGPEDSTETKSLAENTDKDGKAKFGEVKEGNYAVQAAAAGYNTSVPVKVKVKKKTDYTVLLDRIPLVRQPVPGGGAPPVAPGPSVRGPTETPAAPSVPVSTSPASGVPTPQPQPTAAPAPQQGGVPVVVPPEPAAEDYEGFGGDRIRQIIRKFQEKGAISPETALTAEELGLSRLFVRIMKRRRGRTTIFMEINGRYYLNQDALKEK